MAGAAPAVGQPGLVGNVLFIRARADKVGPWVGKGLVGAHVTALGDWTAVTPARVLAGTAAPYDDARSSLATRPVSTALRPAIGFFVHGRRGVVVVQSPGWRTVKRWLVWDPVEGAVRLTRLANARPSDLASAAGVAASGMSAIVAAVRSEHPGPVAWLADVHGALQLPGRALLIESDAPRGELVEPSARRVAAFDQLTREEADHRAEVQPVRRIRRPGAGR